MKVSQLEATLRVTEGAPVTVKIGGQAKNINGEGISIPIKDREAIL
jgi:hypothetical protein